MHLVAPEVGILGTVPLVAATIPLAVGAALASKLRDESRVSVAFFGDGATEEGHFHESVNMASLYRLPVVFVCENNFYSSHMHLLERRSKDNIAAAGDAHDVPAVRLDGNDLEAVHEAAITAVERARNKGGPTLLECRTYRWRGHVGPSWDDDVGVKRKDELREWLPKCPIKRTGELLIELGISEKALQEQAQAVRAEVEDAIEFARRSPDPDPETLADHVFASKGAE